MTFWKFLSFWYFTMCWGSISTSSYSSSVSWSFSLSSLGISWCLLWSPCSSSKSSIMWMCLVLVHCDWKGPLKRNSNVLFKGLEPLLVSGSSWYKGLLVFCRLMENVPWTRDDLMGEGDCEDVSLDKSDSNYGTKGGWPLPWLQPLTWPCLGLRG